MDPNPKQDLDSEELLLGTSTRIRGRDNNTGTLNLPGLAQSLWDQGNNQSNSQASGDNGRWVSVLTCVENISQVGFGTDLCRKQFPGRFLY